MGEMGNLGYLISVIGMCLAIALLLGGLLTYFWLRSSFRRMNASSEQSWLSRLRQTEQDRDSRIAKLTSEVDEHRHQVPTMERSLAERSDIINALESTIESHKVTIKTLEHKLKATIGGLETSNVDVKKLTKLQGDLEISRYETGNLNRELEQLRTRHNEANARAVSIQEELDSVSEANLQQQTLFDDQAGSANHDNEKLDASEQRVTKLRQELSSLGSRYTRLEQKHVSTAAQLEGASNKLKEVKSDSSKFGAREQKLNDRLNEQSIELDSLRVQAQQTNEQLQKFREQGEHAVDLKQQVDRLGEESGEYDSRLAQAEVRKNELEQTLRSRTESLTQVESNYSELTSKCVELEAANAQSTERYQTLNQELEGARLRAREAREEFTEWRSQAQQLENNIHAHEAAAKESKQQTEHWHSEHDTLKAQYSNQTLLAEEALRDLQKLRHELADAKRDAQAGHNKQSEMQQRLEDNERVTSSEMRQYKIQITELEQRVASANQAAEEIVILRRTLEQRDSEFALEHQECNEQRELVGDWRARFETLKNEHDRILALPKITTARKTTRKKPAPVSTTAFEKPDWLLDEVPSEKDDLKKMWGVGPVMEKTMNGLGIYLFRQVASLTEKDIDWVASHINTFPDRINRDNWAGQAAKLRKEKYGC